MNQMAKSLCLLIALALTSLRASAVATCDANGDGEINIADVSYIIDVILNGQSAAAALPFHFFCPLISVSCVLMKSYPFVAFGADVMA